MPKGEIQCVQDGGFQRWYLKESGKRTYISKKKRVLDEKLAIKKYLSALLKSLKQEKTAIEFYLRHHKTNQAEQLIYRASSGNYVRSKSEMMIDMFLHVNKIPFRYECALQLGEIVIYPDFTVKHPITGEIYYWEHPLGSDMIEEIIEYYFK